MLAKSKSRITIACNSCRLRKQKCSGDRPKCIQCLEHQRNCDWPEQLKRGPAKGYIEALEHRLHETESLLLGLLATISDSQLSSSIPPPTVHLRSEKRGSEYWKRFPLRSLQEIRSWQEDCQQLSTSDRASTSTTAPAQIAARTPTPSGVDTSTAPEENSRRLQPMQPEASPEPQLSVSDWSGAPSANFQQQFLW